MKIFTGQITNWDDPEITKDYGAQLPSIPIMPVIRSDGSGATYFFTRWMAHLFPSQWNAFCKQGQPGQGQAALRGRPSSTRRLGQRDARRTARTTWPPTSPPASARALSATTSTPTRSTRTIPVVKVLNPAGYYVLPTASNVAVALTKAQDQRGTRTAWTSSSRTWTPCIRFKDPRIYPLSSYSYLIVPGSTPTNPGQLQHRCEGDSLSTYINYFLCAGQRHCGRARLLAAAAQPGREAGSCKTRRSPGAIPPPSLSSGCANPTLNNGQLYPAECPVPVASATSSARR